MENSKVKLHGIDEIKMTGESKGKLIRIREGDYSETCVKGYFCTFEIRGNPEIIKLGYDTGFGINNSLGFGYTEEHRQDFSPRRSRRTETVARDEKRKYIV